MPEAPLSNSEKPTKGLNKFERIKLVKILGLNTRDVVLITSHNDWGEYQPWLKQFDKYTISAFKNTPTVGTDPYFAVIKATDFENHRKKLLDEEWNIIVSEGVDPKEALFAGTILRDGDLSEVDVSCGAGAVVRDVTHNGKIDKHFALDGLESSGDKLIDEALGKIRSVEEGRPHLPALRRVIYEFSYYKTEVGHKRENAIFWEITGFSNLGDIGISLQDLN